MAVASVGTPLQPPIGYIRVEASDAVTSWPLEGVTVTVKRDLTSWSQVKLTGVGGWMQTKPIPAPEEYTVTLEKEGYKSYTTKLTTIRGRTASVSTGLYPNWYISPVSVQPRQQ